MTPMIMPTAPERMTERLMFPYFLLEKALKDLREARDKGVIHPDSLFWVEEFIHRFSPVRAFAERGEDPSLGQVLAQAYGAWRASVLARGLTDPGPYKAPVNLGGL